MFMCTTKFDIEDKELAFANEYLSQGEKEITIEERKAQDQDQLEPISDDEGLLPPSQARTASQSTPNRRQKRTLSVNEHEASQYAAVDSDDDEGALPLPTQQNIQQRISGRARKIPKSFEGFDVSRS